MKTTTKERDLIDAIVESEYRGESTDDPEAFCREAVWTACVGDAYEARGHRRDGMGGVMASLIDKGLVRSQDVGASDEGTCSITAEGLAEYKARHGG